MCVYCVLHLLHCVLALIMDGVSSVYVYINFCWKSNLQSDSYRCLDFLIIELKLAVRACTTSLNSRAEKTKIHEVFTITKMAPSRAFSWLKKTPTSALVWGLLSNCENFAKVRFELYLIVRLNECADNQGLNYLWSRVRYQDHRV